MSGLRNGDLLFPPDSVTALYEGVGRIKISFFRKVHQRRVSFGFLLRANTSLEGAFCQEEEA